MRTEQFFDVVVVGTGAGGATMAHALAGSGASVLLLERGHALPSEPENWDPEAVWRDRRYRVQEQWLAADGTSFQPFMHYVVGGNTKMWGAALFRLRDSDFGEVQHRDGISPAWPIGYTDMAQWYDAAEALYRVRGLAEGDPTEPDRKPYPYAPVPHEPAIAAYVEGLKEQGLHPFHLPLALIDPGAPGGCQLCDTCNSFPCRVRAKGDAEVICVEPAVAADNVALWTGARAERLVTDPSGRRVRGVEVETESGPVRVDAGLVVVSAGAVNSTALMLRSATNRHPDGLGNSSGLVGRNYMAHLATMMEAFHPFRVNDTVFQKTVALNDFYEAGPGRPYPLGHLQSQGRAHGVIAKQVVDVVPRWAYDAFVRRGVDWLAMTEDLPSPDNRVTLTSSGQIRLSYRANNHVSHALLVKEAVRMLRRLGFWTVIKHRFENENTTHQCGTMVFGAEPATSVLDPWCRMHDLDNVYVVDASFFPSSAAVNPGLTVIAQSLRVADHLLRTDLNHLGGTR
jgi:choline dehydrogenase-like flavoprotein